MTATQADVQAAGADGEAGVNGQAGATFNMLISGVGGQGVVLASYVLSQVAMAEGYDVKQSEVHGMSQRGGSVTSHFRFGEQVWSPLVTPGHRRHPAGLRSPGGAALRPLAASERASRLQRHADQPQPGGRRTGRRTRRHRRADHAAWPNVRAIDANALAQQAGTVKAANVVMLGAVSGALPFTAETWETVIRRVVPPKTVDVNLEAFRVGAAAAASN